MIKKLLATITVAGFLWVGITPSQAAGQEIHNKLFIDQHEAIIAGETVTLEVPPRVWEGTTMLPLRFVVENILGATVDWDQTTQTITIYKEDTVVRLTLNNPKASVNGQTTELAVPPFTEQDRTLVPVRFLAETFGYEVHYDSEEQSVSLRPAMPPVAQFRLSAERIVAGQKVWAEDLSYDPYGYPIVERRWQVNRDPRLRTANLASIFTSPGPGVYIVELQVKNKAGRWSEWAAQTLVVEPNSPPVVEELRPVDPVIDQGEDLHFIHRAKNEDWEEIVEERWTYRHLEQDLKGIGKPRSLFAAGEYEVTLEVKDAYGNWSKPASTVVTVTDTVRSGELEYKFRKPVPGEIIDNPAHFNYNHLTPEQNYTIRTGGPTLLLSNSPEIVPEPGILYRDKLAGSFRVMFHHINNSAAVNRLAVIIENQGNEPVILTKLKAVAVGPTTDVMHLGQLLALEYLQAAEQQQEVILEPGSRYLLYQSPATGWKLNQAVTGIFDLLSSGPVSVTVAALPFDDDWDLNALFELPLLPRDVHPRGTFPNADHWIEVFLFSGEPRKIELGKNLAGFDTWLGGYDALTGAPVQNVGNYGSIYYLTFVTSDRTGIILNPRGLNFKGAFTGLDGKSYKAPSYDSFQGSRRAAVIGVLEPGEPKTIVYTPPNASDAPVIFGLIPEDYWSEM